jgi:metal-sulfur cluster biosynthetic enzyme
VSDGRVKVDMVLTTKACPMASHLTEQVKHRLDGLHCIREVDVRVIDGPRNWEYFVRQQRARA